MWTVTITLRSSGWPRWRSRVILDSRRLSCAASRGSSWSTSHGCWRLGMNTSERRPGQRVRGVRFTEDVLVVDLLDGRTISVPLVWYPRLLSATPGQRANWRAPDVADGIDARRPVLPAEVLHLGRE